MHTIILSQGKFVHKDSLTFPIEERGLQFGDGVYEVIRIYDGVPYLIDEHVTRLFRSLQAIDIEFNYTINDVKDLLQRLIDKNDMSTDGFIYLQVTRGSAQRGHAFPEETTANFYAYLRDFERPIELLEKGIKTILLPDERWAQCHIKSLNLLPNVLAKQKAAENDAYDAILHREGTVTEGASSNIFLIKDKTVYTHPATERILNGCVRMAVKGFAEQRAIPFIEKAFTIEDIKTADEMFLTSSLSEVLPIVQVDEKIIGDGKPGTITNKLLQAYKEDARLTEKKQAAN